MKRIRLIATIIIALVSTFALAQENQNEYRSIFNKNSGKKVEHGGYGSFGVGYSAIDGKDALLLNFRGAWVIDHNVAIGFSGTGFFNNLDKTADPNQYYLAGGYGGFLIEPILFPRWPVHLSFPILIGGGAVSTIPHDYLDWNYAPYGYDYDVYFVAEPGVEMEINMVRFFRLTLGATYRITNGVLLKHPDFPEVPNNALDGMSFYMNFKFGKF